MAAQWPTTVATDSNLYIAVNELQNNLSAGVNNAVTTLGLNSTTSFATVGLVLIDNEVIKYTGVSGNNLTGCTRGFDGTTAASHSSGAVVSFAFCAAHHNVLKDEIEAVETYLSNNLGTGSQPLSNGSRALASSAGGKITESSVTSTELGYLSGVTSAIQTQLNAAVQNPLTGNLAAGSHKLTGLAAGSTSGDSVRYEQAILADGTNAFTANQSMGSHKITSLTNGSAAADAMAYGQNKIFQNIYKTSTSSTTATSTTYVSTGLSQAITPTSSSSRIRIRVCTYVNTASAGSTATYNIFNGTTQLITSGIQVSMAATGRAPAPICFFYEDSPATTSAVTYTVQIKSSGAVNQVDNVDGLLTQMTLEEIQ